MSIVQAEQWPAVIPAQYRVEAEEAAMEVWGPGGLERYLAVDQLCVVTHQIIVGGLMGYGLGQSGCDRPTVDSGIRQGVAHDSGKPQTEGISDRGRWPSAKILAVRSIHTAKGEEWAQMQAGRLPDALDLAFVIKNHHSDIPPSDHSDWQDPARAKLWEMVKVLQALDRTHALTRPYVGDLIPKQRVGKVFEADDAQKTHALPNAARLGSAVIDLRALVTEIAESPTGKAAA